MTVKLEKQQVALIAQFVGEILSDLPVPDPLPDDDTLALAEPVMAEWAVGGLQLSYDNDADRLVLLAEETGRGGGRGRRTSETELGRRATPPGPGAGPRQPSRPGRRPARDSPAPRPRPSSGGRWDLVSAGRPTCALCGNPIDPGRSLVPADERSRASDVLTLLEGGSVELQGRMPWSSNGTFLVSVTGEGEATAGRLQAGPGRAPVVGLPGRALPAGDRGLRPLRSPGLGPRSRDDRPGRSPPWTRSLQRFVDADFEQHYFTLLEDDARHAVPQADGHLRRHRQQRRPQGRPLPPRRR